MRYTLAVDQSVPEEGEDVQKKVLRKVLIVATIMLCCLGLATCEKSCDNPFGGQQTDDTKKPSPAAPHSKWVGKWVNLKGTVSYVIQSEKNGKLYGYIPRGEGKEKVTMSIVNANTVSYVTPIGVKISFKLKGSNQLTMTSLGISAKALKIVK